MALKTITLSLATPNEGFPWSVTFTSDDSTPIKNITEFSLSLVEPSFPNLFTVSNFAGYGGENVEYVTWRSVTPDGQFPTSGYSLDIWDSTFYENIINHNLQTGMTWNEMLTGNGSGEATYNLSKDKNSLVYNYDSPSPICFSKGGALTVSVV